MNGATLRGAAVVAVVLGISAGPGAGVARGQDAAKPGGGRPAGPWRASGRVTDGDGRPMAGVEVSAHCGMGTLRTTGTATSGADGRYELDFGPGIHMVNSAGPALQAATISAHRPGYFEANLGRQGDCLAAGEMPDDDQLKHWGGRRDRVFLPGRPLEINFVMRPSGRVAGILVDEDGKPLAGYSVSLTGPDLPPSSSVVAWTQADDRGRFSLEDVPTNFRYQFAVRQSKDLKPPWNDSWASAGMRFEQPEAGDLRASFGDREIRVREFVLRIAGPGVHERTATRTAGNLGVLDLHADDPADVQEQTDRRIVARSAVLTLRNGSRPGPSATSLIAESVPAAPAEPSITRLARTRPDDAGAFVLSFENPRGFDLKPGQHQLIFQVLVGASRTPIRERIFRQLNIRPDGRYRVPVTIRPEWIDDSRVSITFVTIQPQHDAWVRSFFLEGKGTSYQGIWGSDGGLMPEIPFETGGK